MNRALAVQPYPLADWHGISPDAWTAIGTIALAGATLIALLVTIILALLSGKQVRKERSEVLEAEQLAEAYAIQVIGSETTALIVNHGKYTISGVDARIRLKRGGDAEFTSRTRFLDTHEVDQKLIDGIPVALRGTTPAAHSDILAPWDAGLRLELDPAQAGVTLIGAYPVVRWTDRWDIHWEHELGHVKRVKTAGWPLAVSGTPKRRWHEWASSHPPDGRAEVRARSKPQSTGA